MVSTRPRAGAAMLCRMPSQARPGPPVVVTLPAEIDLSNVGDVFGSIAEALTAGVTVVIADLTGTTFCDTTALTCLAHAHRVAAARQTQLRFVITSAGAVRRVAELAGLDCAVPVYPGLQQAIDAC